jgi:DNA polymerase-3 subunit epsilon
MRFAVIDTETTGLNPESDRIFEIACVEIENLTLTGREFHALIDPECEISPESATICKKTTSDVRGKPKFSDVIHGFLDVINYDSRGEEDRAIVVAHNAKFDIGFINNELKRASFHDNVIHFVSTYPLDGNLECFFLLDTVKMAKIRYPGKSVTLDNMCDILGIDLSVRDGKGHGALIDSKLLCEVFLSFLREEGEDYVRTFDKKAQAFFGFACQQNLVDGIISVLSEEEQKLHHEMLSVLGLAEAW